jgi:hypothetical protein
MPSFFRVELQSATTGRVPGQPFLTIITTER